MDIIQQLSQPLPMDAVNYRVQSISAKGWATILAYKDARVDMDRLDSVCGVLWQRDHRIIDGNLYCGIGIKHEGEWIWRWDVGTESNADAEKGQASDSFKRAGFNWGIGRELYSLPRLFLQLGPKEFKLDGQRAKQTFDLKLNKWTWLRFGDDNEHLAAKDQDGLVRFDSRKEFNSYGN